MKRIALLTVVWIGVVVACARGDEQVASGLVAVDTATPNADISSVPPPSKATGKQLGIALAANMYGELEPCG
jgi:hypothetical protein